MSVCVFEEAPDVRNSSKYCVETEMVMSCRRQHIIVEEEREPPPQDGIGERKALAHLKKNTPSSTWVHSALCGVPYAGANGVFGCLVLKFYLVISNV